MRIAHLAVLGILVTACAAAPATPSPAPTAAPTPSSAPTPSAKPTAIPVATYTSGDERVDSTIRDGFAELSGYIGDIDNAADVFAMVDVYRSLASFAGSQSLIAISLQPSSCTADALALWVDAMELTEQLAKDYLDAWESGNFDDFNSDAGYDAGVKARSAIDTLNAGC